MLQFSFRKQVIYRNEIPALGILTTSLNKKIQEYQKNGGKAKFWCRPKPQESEAWQEYYKVKSRKKMTRTFWNC